MSIAGSMFTAKTALDAFGESMGVIGHNIANLNTVGFKSSRMDFADILPTITGELETGHGVRVSDVSGPFQQGAIETSANVTDLAIEGGGYFLLNNANGDTYYTRAGQFHLNNLQQLVNPEGLTLQGAAGNISLAGVSTVPALQRALWRSRLISMQHRLHQPRIFPSVQMLGKGHGFRPATFPRSRQFMIPRGRVTTSLFYFDNRHLILGITKWWPRGTNLILWCPRAPSCVRWARVERWSFRPTAR